MARTAARWHAQPRLVQGAATGVSADAAGGIPRYGITRRGGNNDRLSTLWREVISLAWRCKVNFACFTHNHGHQRWRMRCPLRAMDRSPLHSMTKCENFVRSTGEKDAFAP
jgi:hypothetical protein